MLSRKFAAVLLSILMFSPLAVAVEPVSTGIFSKTALSGYDAVAYFTEGAAFKGKKEFQHEWNGANWRFKSEENLTAFALDPEAYAPQFGGYCAFAVGQNATAPGDPQQFSITDNKLYLNYSSKTRVLWEDDKEAFIEAGHGYWPDLINK